MAFGGWQFSYECQGGGISIRLVAPVRELAANYFPAFVHLAGIFVGDGLFRKQFLSQIAPVAMMIGRAALYTRPDDGVVLKGHFYIPHI